MHKSTILFRILVKLVTNAQSNLCFYCSLLAKPLQRKNTESIAAATASLPFYAHRKGGNGCHGHAETPILDPSILEDILRLERDVELWLARGKCSRNEKHDRG